MRWFLIFTLQLQTSFLKGTPHGNADGRTGNQQPRARRWTFGSFPGSSGWTAERKDQYQEDSDQQLLIDEADGIVTDHVYYTSTFYSRGQVESKELWMNIDELDREQQFVSQTQAQRVSLSFDFPFYGHLLTEVSVAPEGFISTGDHVHQMLSATQYIAPLMADFDPSLAHDSSIFYFDNGTVLVVQWDRLLLHHHLSLGGFTFQAALHCDGRIVFSYKQIPVELAAIAPIAPSHPVKVGLADAFAVLHEVQQIPNVRRRTIYEYHKVEIPKSKISNWTAVEMIPLPTCLQFSSCGQCVTSQIGFNCSWCSRLQRCSSGFDRHRQDWVDQGCLDQRRDPRCFTDTPSLHQKTTFASTPSEQRAVDPTAATFGKNSPKNTSRDSKSHTGPQTLSRGSSVANGSSAGSDEQLQTGLLAGVAVVTAVAVTAVGVSVYVYAHPSSRTSLFFMDRRPTRWPILKFRRGSGRPSYLEVEAPDVDKDGGVVIDPKQCFVISDRRESEQKEGFMIPDQRERFLHDAC